MVFLKNVKSKTSAHKTGEVGEIRKIDNQKIGGLKQRIEGLKRRIEGLKHTVGGYK